MRYQFKPPIAHLNLVRQSLQNGKHQVAEVLTKNEKLGSFYVNNFNSITGGELSMKIMWFNKRLKKCLVSGE
jgi:hypothetical protein